MILVGAQTPTRVHKSIKELNPSFKTKLKRNGNSVHEIKKNVLPVNYFLTERKGFKYLLQYTARTACTTDLLCSNFEPYHLG